MEQLYLSFECKCWWIQFGEYYVVVVGVGGGEVGEVVLGLIEVVVVDDYICDGGIVFVQVFGG